MVDIQLVTKMDFIALNYALKQMDQWVVCALHSYCRCGDLLNAIQPLMMVEYEASWEWHYHCLAPRVHDLHKRG